VRDLSTYTFSPLRDAELALYRGSGKGLPPILLVATENSSLSCLTRLEHEYALREDLDAGWAARPIEISSHRNRLALVLEDPGGRLLERLLGAPLGIAEFLRIAISLAGALHQTHGRGLIHKDIRPANILVDAASGNVWLTGFGIASRLPREQPIPEPPDAITGTLAYMAPEQTGRMNRSIDLRSDLYSLGITFYEMLTGRLPFSADDPLGWVHCHIAMHPVPPDGRLATIPTALSNITMKLLAKTAEERYQTAAGLQVDLRRCLAQWRSEGRIDPFPLGTRDGSDRLLIPEHLYGRHGEIETMIACFDSVVTRGLPELVLVSGYSGIGKSSVVHELHKLLPPTRGMFASGKFDQYKRDIPYATLAQALQSLVHSLLGHGDAQLDRWRQSFKEALGSNGQLIANLVPELEHIIGKQPPVTELPPQEARNRFQRIFRRFLGVLACKEHPLALFLDDLQWLDGATLEVLEYLATHTEGLHLLLVLAYRNNEVGPSHPLMRALTTIRHTDVRVHEILLEPLQLRDLGQLIADTLHCEPERVRPLAQIVLEKTGGNPFFAIQFLTNLAEEELLTFDREALAWVWDTRRIHAKEYTDNVVAFLVRKIRRLPPATRAAIQQVACLGHMVEIGTLSTAYRQEEQAMHAALWEAVRAGLIVRQGNGYKFLHDRIQQAAYSLLPEAQRAETHLAIARVLLASLPPDALAEQLFEVANQFNRATVLLADSTERATVATLNLRTGRKAKASAAYASAGTYFSLGIALLEEGDWACRHELAFNLSRELAECTLLGGNIEVTEQLVAELLQRAASNIEFADGSCLKIILHVLKREHPRAVDCALECLRRFGIDLPTHPTSDHIQVEYDTVWQALDGRPIESLLALPLMTDPQVQAAVQVLSSLAAPATATDFRLFCVLACRMAVIGIRYGICGATAHGCALLGAVLGPVFQRHDDGYRFARIACELVERHGLIGFQPKVYHATATVALWTQTVATALQLMRATSRAAMETGDLTFACYGLYQTVTVLLLRGDPLDAVWRESKIALDFARDGRFDDAVDIVISQQRFIAAMQGRTATFSTFSDAHFDEAAFEARLPAERMAPMVCWYWILKLQARFLSGDYADALAAAAKVKPFLLVPTPQIQLLQYCEYLALTVAACYENATPDQQAKWRELLTEHLGQLRRWADNNPSTFGDKHALVSAEMARLDDRYGDAMSLYEQAIQSARENGLAQDEGIAHELAARFYAARGAKSIADAALHNARHCYLRWGALGKVRQLEEDHPWLAAGPDTSVPSATISAPVGQLDVGTVVKASQAVSSEIEFGKLVETLITLSVEHAGAERGLLILFTGDEPRIAAEATTSRGNIEVKLRDSVISPSELLEPVLHTALRTYESVILDDASTSTPYAANQYVRQKCARSVLCLPLVKQGSAVGALYLENNLSPGVFTSSRLAVLNLLASQAAISLENVRLYDELRREIGERRRAEQGLLRSEAYMHHAQAASHTGSFGWNAVTDALYCSAETYRIFAIDRSAPPALAHIIRQTHPDDRAFVEQALDRARSEKRDFDLEHRLLMSDGSVKYLQVVARASADESGRLEYVGAVMDITQRKHAEQAQRDHERERDDMQRQLQQAAKMEAVGRLAGGIAHDFNNILGAILGYGELAQNNLNEGDPARRQIDQVMHAGARGKELVHRILAFSRSDMGERVPLAVQSIVEEALELLVASMPAGIRLERHLDAIDLAVVGDATQFHQVVMNLCTNAVHAMEGNGVLTVVLEQAAHSERRKLSHGTLGAGNYVRLLVADTGGGIPPAVLKRMFDPFFTTKRVGDGTGLGLALVQGIVAELGGAIDVATQLNVGTTITIWLPAVARAPKLPAEPAGALPRGKGETIMIVDDEPALVALAEETLADLGYEPLGFSSSLAALQAFRDEPKRFDLVLTDEMMPDLTGTDLAREILRLRPESPIIIMSGYGGPQLSERAKAAGVLNVLRKPLVRRDIAEPVARALQTQH
jgi:predicted ATPase/signal transduction histidine kinase/ActR/RegA family two-component response regulator